MAQRPLSSRTSVDVDILTGALANSARLGTRGAGALADYPLGSTGDATRSAGARWGGCITGYVARLRRTDRVYWHAILNNTARPPRRHTARAAGRGRHDLGCGGSGRTLDAFPLEEAQIETPNGQQLITSPPARQRRRGVAVEAAPVGLALLGLHARVAVQVDAARGVDGGEQRAVGAAVHAVDARAVGPAQEDALAVPAERHAEGGPLQVAAGRGVSDLLPGRRVPEAKLVPQAIAAQHARVHVPVEVPVGGRLRGAEPLPRPWAALCCALGFGGAP
eukprot:scaffold68863_cov61-Phaeocystis_antarctica.AAC.2